MTRRKAYAIAAGFVGTLVALGAGSVLAHGDHDHDEPVPVCVLVMTDDPPAEWHAEALMDGLAKGTLTIVEVDPGACGGGEVVLTPGEPPTDEAVEAWQTISSSVFAEQLDWEEFIFDGGIGMSTAELQDVQSELRGYVALLEEVGAHPCYAEIHGDLLESAGLMDEAITDLIDGESTRGWLRLDDASSGVYDYWLALEDRICER